YTVYCQKYWDTPPNHWIQVFHSPSWSQVYKIKHLGMQTASTNICERTSRSQELSEFKWGTVIGCHLCNKSIHISPATQPRSGRQRKMTERESIAKDLQTSCGLQIKTTVHRELHGMGFHGRAAASKPYITMGLVVVRRKVLA
ncbi:unnamed protein product, partial [Staurois parvus]